jgi:hypothetical protein
MRLEDREQTTFERRALRHGQRANVCSMPPIVRISSNK